MVEVAFTDLSLSLGDMETEDVRARALQDVAEATGATPVTMRQVHGRQVVVVDEVSATSATTATCDALVTSQAGTALLARAADCVPVLVADPETGILGAAHAGRNGVFENVVAATVEEMRRLGARPSIGWIGPSVCGRCYEVPAEMREGVMARVPAAASTTAWGTPALDLAAAVRSQLAAVGVEDIREVGVCTREDESWPSYRRDREAATRFAGVIWSHA